VIPDSKADQFSPISNFPTEGAGMAKVLMGMLKTPAHFLSFNRSLSPRTLIVVE